MRTPTKPLSDINIRDLKSGHKAYKVSDFEGLFILVKVSGAKSWRFKYRMDGKERLLVISDYPAVTLAKARQARDIVKAQATTRIGLKLLAILARRPGEVRNAKWEEFDLVEHVWSIPAAKMKMRRDHNVPLPDQAIELLEQLQAMNNIGVFCFPRCAHGPARCPKTR